jgi:hypothetical protein
MTQNQLFTEVRKMSYDAMKCLEMSLALTLNQRVVGSIPTSPTININKINYLQ